MTSAPPKAKKSKKTRAKLPAKPPLVRGEAVVQRVLEAALQELAQVGYRAFRIEEVALRADVNKTTVYRRWPLKADLVRDALAASSADKFVAPQTGALRSDLLALVRMFLEQATTPMGRSLMRMLAAEASDPELIDISRSLRARHEVMPQALLAAAVARGELAPDADHMVILHALIGAIHHRLFLMNEPVTEAFLTGLVDLLLLGALAPSARRPRDASRRGRPQR
jgi:AcrR family transcriptional regulator